MLTKSQVTVLAAAHAVLAEADQQLPVMATFAAGVTAESYRAARRAIAHALTTAYARMGDTAAEGWLDDDYEKRAQLLIEAAEVGQRWIDAQAELAGDES